MRTFTAFNRQYEYFPELGERTIEIPIALDVYKRIYPKKIIEVGYVLARQIAERKLFPRNKAHRVIDLFDPSPQCENMDGCLADYREAFVFSISTLEHFDMPDYGNEKSGGNKGMQCLERIMSQASGYFITLPVGYNKAMDAAVRSLGVSLAMFKEVSGPTNEFPDEPPIWRQLEEPDWSVEYGKPFHYANGIVVISTET